MKRTGAGFQANLWHLIGLDDGKRGKIYDQTYNYNRDRFSSTICTPPLRARKDRDRYPSRVYSQSDQKSSMTQTFQEPTTPDQPTKPSDPKLTGESSATVESQAEESTKKLLVVFLGETMDALDREFGYLYWQTSGHKVHLFQTYSFMLSSP